MIPLVTGIRPSRRLESASTHAACDRQRGQCPGRSAGPICPRRMDGSCRGAVCEGRGRDAAPRSPLGRSQAGTGFDAAGGTRIGGNQGRPVFRGTHRCRRHPVGSAAYLRADEGSHSELEEQPRRGRIPVIEWLDETVNALNDETPFRLRFLAVGDRLDVELDWQEGSGTSLRAACLLDQLEHLAEQLVIDGSRKISAADLVPVAHRSKLPDIGQLLNTVPLESVPQMLALAAEAHPLRSAVEHGTRSWSYGKFDEVVRRIAGALYAAGARRCDVIAVTGERSCALVASMAAVLRAGGVLLCLDQNLPPVAVS